MKGYFRVAAAVPRVTVADPAANADAIIGMARNLADCGARLIVFPELALTAYTCGDLLLTDTLLDAAHEQLHRVAEATAQLPAVMVVGLPLVMRGAVHNCAAVISSGEVKALVSKIYLPTYGEFYERRWFHPADANSTILVVDGVRIGVEICEDMWVPTPPSSHLAMAGADVIVNLSASDTLVGKRSYLEGQIKRLSAAYMAAYVYAGAGFGESTTDLVFDGKAIISENGALLADSPAWSLDPVSAVADVDIAALRHDRLHHGTYADCAARENANREFTFIDCTPRSSLLTPDSELLRSVDPHPFVPSDPATLSAHCTEIVNIQAFGLAKRLDATRCRSLVVGISGGLDSTLALLVACRAFDLLKLPRTGILGVTMPGFGTTGRTHTNALALMTHLGVAQREISIVPAVNQHFADIGHDPQTHDVTYENSQARERTQLLMDLANKTGGMVLGTGDLSELALGWATYNGDHMSMYGVNAGVPKTLVRHLVQWFADNAESDAVRATLRDIIDTPISPELIPAAADGSIAQRTEDLVGPYELHDFFLYHLLRFGATPQRIFFLANIAFKDSYDADTIKHWLRTFTRRFFNQQFKRSCMPDGPKVGSVCLSPRGDWRMPSDASAALWLRECDAL